MELRLWVVLFSVIVVNGATLPEECGTDKTLTRGSGPYQDHTLTDGWYKVPDYKLADKAVLPGQCGAKHPIWGRGPFPDNGDVSVCVADEHDDSCGRNFTIQITDCDDYAVYNLTKTNSVGEAYCFEHDDDDEYDDDDCEEKKDYGKEFHRCHRSHRSAVVLIGGIVIIVLIIAIVAFCVYRKRLAAELKRKEAYKVMEKTQQNAEGPVVVATNDTLPPKY